MSAGSPSPPKGAAAYKLASLLLQYPTTALFDGLDELDAHAAALAPKQTREAFARFLGWLRRTPPSDVAQHYVETFELPSKGRRHAPYLYLTYYRYGDTRKRGLAMVQFKSAYRVAGFTPCSDELPDYLPMVLDFAAAAPRGERLLHMHRDDLELLRRALARAGTPYVDVVAAVAERLPRLGRRELARVAAAWESGPPREEVGLEPFAPPDYLAGYGAGQGAQR